MTEFLLLCIWLLVAYAEQIAHACLFAVAAVSWLVAGGLGLLIIWLFR